MKCAMQTKGRLVNIIRQPEPTTNRRVDKRFLQSSYATKGKLTDVLFQLLKLQNCIIKNVCVLL